MVLSRSLLYFLSLFSLPQNSQRGWGNKTCLLGEQRAETKLTTGEMGPHYLLQDSVLEHRGRERETLCFYPSSRGDPVGMLVTGQRYMGRSAYRLVRLSSSRVELKLKIRLSGSPANQQRHSFPVTSLQVWGSIPGRQCLARSHHHLWNYMCSGTI